MLNVKSGLSVLDKTTQKLGRPDQRGYNKRGCKVSYRVDMFRGSQNSLGSNRSSMINSRSPNRGKLSPHKLPYNAIG